MIDLPDSWALLGTALAQFAGAVVNPLAWAAMIVAAFAMPTRTGRTRAAGVVIGLLGALPAALPSPTLAEAGVGLLGGSAGGLLLAEVTTSLVVPGLRLVMWFFATAADLLRLAALRLTAARVRPPPIAGAGGGGNRMPAAKDRSAVPVRRRD